MVLNLTAFPNTIDLLHVILAGLAFLFIVLAMAAKKSGNPTSSITEQSPSAEQTSEPVTTEPAPVTVPAEVAKETSKIEQTTPDSALQLLALLQQDGRFIDFISEDLQGFSDADVGAAARVVHEGSKKTINTYFTLTPIRAEEEESALTIESGFNASEIRLTGNVVGQAPFKGVLVHKGWKASEVKLPKLAKEHDASIIAPAEVELS